MKSICIRYEILNTGENSFETNLKIALPFNITKFLKSPSGCEINDQLGEMDCHIGLISGSMTNNESNMVCK